MPTKMQMIAATLAAAAKNGLRSALVCGLVERESSWNPWQIRYEPAFFNKYVMPLYSASKINVTEAKARSFSWGLMQIMGEEAREFGFTGDLASLCDPDVGLEWGCRALAHKLKVNGGNEPAALLAYNGGSNPHYPDEVLALAAKYEPPAPQSPSGGKAISA